MPMAPAPTIEPEVVEERRVEAALFPAPADEPDLVVQQRFQESRLCLGLAQPAQLGRAELCRKPQRFWNGTVETPLELGQRRERVDRRHHDHLPEPGEVIYVNSVHYSTGGAFDSPRTPRPLSRQATASSLSWREPSRPGRSPRAS